MTAGPPRALRSLNGCWPHLTGKGPSGRAWRLEFDSDGSRFVWTGLALTQRDAELVARDDLAIDHADFNRAARLVVCIDKG
jgi:hypothetical protein